MKKNNKGFSLVELIVVVLIMAIIAVALAPQVMKWVENSRKSTDCSNYDAVVEAVNLALANEDVMQQVGGMSAASVDIEWSTGSNSQWTVPGDISKVGTQIESILGSSWKTSMKVKRTTDLPSGNKYTIKVYKNGTVERGVAPTANVS